MPRTRTLCLASQPTNPSLLDVEWRRLSLLFDSGFPRHGASCLGVAARISSFGASFLCEPLTRRDSGGFFSRGLESSLRPSTLLRARSLTQQDTARRILLTLREDTQRDVQTFDGQTSICRRQQVLRVVAVDSSRAWRYLYFKNCISTLNGLQICKTWTLKRNAPGGASENSRCLESVSSTPGSRAALGAVAEHHAQEMLNIVLASCLLSFSLLPGRRLSELLFPFPHTQHIILLKNRAVDSRTAC